MLRRHLNFRQISHRFTSSFTNPSFQDLNGSHIMYWNMINFKSVEVQGWTPLEILIFLHWTCRPTVTTLLGKRRAISHLIAVPKNRGKYKSATISLHRGDSLSTSGPPVYLLTVRFITYQHHSLAPIKYLIIASALPFDRRWLISFMAIVLMTQTYKRLQKLKRQDYKKLKWLIFLCFFVTIGLNGPIVYHCITRTKFNQLIISVE